MRLILMLLLISELAIGQFIAIPDSSDLPFQQGRYLAYQRQFKKAQKEFQKAAKSFEQQNKMDSLAYSLLYEARMWSVQTRSDSASICLENAEKILSTLRDTNPEVTTYYHYVRAGEAMNVWDLEAAESLYLQAINRSTKAFGECNQRRCLLLNDLCIVNLVQYRYLVADSLTKAMLSCADTIFDVNDNRMLPMYNMAGIVAQSLGYHQEAVEHYEKALRVTKENLGDESYTYARILANLANVVYVQGGAMEAIEMLQKSIEISQKHDDFSLNGSMNYYNVANYFYSIGYRNKALEYLEKGLSSLPEDETKHPAETYLTYQLMSALMDLLGRPEESKIYFDKAVGFIERRFGTEFEGLAQLYQRQAGLLFNKGKYRLSLQKFEENIQRFQDYGWDPVTIDRSEDYGMASESAFALGDTGKAIKYIKLAIKDVITAPPTKRMEASWAYAKLSDYFIEARQLDSASVYLSKAFKIILKDTSDFDLLDIQPLSTYINYPYIRDVLNVRIHLLQAKFAQSNNIDFLDLAIKESLVIQSIFKQTTSNYLEGEDAIERINLYWDYFENFVETTILAYGQSQNDKYLHSALNTVEQTKDILYKMFLQSASAAESFGIPDSIIKKEEVIMAEIEALKESLYSAQLDPTSGDLSKIEDDVFNKQKEYDEFKNQLSIDFKEYYQARHEDPVVDFHSLQRHADKTNTTILNYFLGDEQAFVFVINPDEIDVYQLHEPKELELVANQAIESIRTLGTELHLKRLYEIAVQPVIDKVSERNLLIVPDGKLHFIPFEALIDENGKYLIETFDIHYTHSLSPILSEKRNNDNMRMLGMAPGFDMGVKIHLKKLFPEQNFDELDFLPQPNAEDLIGHLPHKMDGDYFTSSKATEARFKQLVSQSNVVLLATHAEVDDAHPLYSRIALLPDEGSEEDGYLHAYEIYNLNLDHELTILSACETGVGQLDRGQGAASLSHAFRFAGCESIIMSLWSIDEKQSVRLISDYLEALLEGQGKSSALSSVKRSYLSSVKGELQHPYYWAGLVLVGNNEVLIASNSWLYWLGAIILCFALILFFYLKRSS